MCELMAMSFESPISADFSIREFAARGDENADGWGLGWYPDRSLAVVKEPLKWRESRHASFLEDYSSLHSGIYLAHVRHKTRGGPATRADTHPFNRELGGREYCFAHNGTLDDRVWNLPLGPSLPLGTTDSEHLFCHLLHELADRGAHLDTENDWRWLHAKFADLNRLGTMNCMLSDGCHLFCYHDATGWKGLTYREVRLRDHQTRHLEDDTVSIDLETDCVNYGFIVATRPLSASGWQPFRTAQLIVLTRGTMRYSGQADGEDSGSWPNRDGAPEGRAGLDSIAGQQALSQQECSLSRPQRKVIAARASNQPNDRHSTRGRGQV